MTLNLSHHRVIRLLLATLALLLMLPGAATAQASFAPSNGGLLPVAQAFHVDASIQRAGTIHLHWTIADHYYLYRGRIHIKAPGNAVKLGKLALPDGLKEHDPYLGDIEIYHHDIDATLPYTVLKSGVRQFQLAVQMQGCHDIDPKVCYPPYTQTLTLSLPTAAAVTPASHDGNDSSGTPLALVLLLALGGGLLLNLMPCVLPVLSLKAVTLLESGENHATARRHVLLYTAGVLASFAVVGMIVVALHLRWGVQLQQPVFVGAMVYLVLAMGLGFSGVVQFGAGLANIGQSMTRRSGPLGDFITGVLAVVVASACTTPFMGTALAYALNAPPLSALLVFLVLGVGLALPFLLIGFVPSLARLLPKPGAWMETLKQVLAFPLYLTAAWLAWVLAHQRGADAVGLLLVGAVLLALALWWFERSRFRGTPSKLLAGALLLVALTPLALIAQLSAPAAMARMETGITAYSPTRLAALRAKGTPVFVDMTADWCTSCQFNEHTVLNTMAFRDLLERTHTVYMKGDWTNEDPAITAFLRRYHSPGVPVYVVFPADGGPGHKLPTILTMGTVRRAIEAAAR